MKLNFRYSLENFRGVAIIFVMLSHIGSFKSMGQYSDYLFYFLVDATAWFVFISGYLFYYLEIEKFNYTKYLARKLKFVILPYLILSVPAIAAGLYLSRNILMDLTASDYAIWSILTGGTVVAPMWFIPMIAVFFLLTPLLSRIAKSPLLLAVTVTGLLFSIFSFRPVHNSNAIFSFLHFAGFYLLGISAAKHALQLDAISDAWKVRIIVLSLLAFVLIGFSYPGMEAEPISFLGTIGGLNYPILGKLALLVAIFFAFERFFNVQNKSLSFMAKISFGLFFIHGFATLVFVKWLNGLAYPGDFSRLGAEVFFVVGGSIVVVYVLRRVLGKWSRYVIGC